MIIIASCGSCYGHSRTRAGTAGGAYGRRAGPVKLRAVTDSWLPAEHGTDNQNLQRRVTRGVGWTIADNWGRQLLNLLVFIIIARLLLPEEFGLVALAMVFVVLAQLFVDQGLGDAIVQRRQVAREHIDTAFAAAMLLGSVLTVTGFLVAGPIGGLLGEPRLGPLLSVLSLTFVMTAAGAIPMALLQRELRFRSLALRTLFSISVGGMVGIAMAYMGYGAWALVGQQLTAAAVSVVALWLASPWRPGLQFSRTAFRELFGFGVNVVGSDLMHYLTRYTDNFLIGVFRSTQELGIYAVGYRILDSTNSLLIGIARKIAFPGLSRLQGDPERTKRAYFRLTRLSAAIILPAYTGLALIAPELIRLVFGAQWVDSGPVAAVLFLVGPTFAVQGFAGALLMAAGRPDIVLRFRFINMLLTVIGFTIAVPFGILAMAASFVIRGYLMLPVQLYYQRVYAGIPIGEYLARLRNPLAATGLMVAVALGARLLLGPDAERVALLVSQVVAGALAYVAATFVLDRSLILEALSVAGQVLPGGERVRRRLGRRASNRPPDPTPSEPESTHRDRMDDD
ncbi:lipopolysaccharide biosynthesis protein [soil metagenome]